MNKVRWGIIGAGRIAHTFARDCVFTTNAEVYAVASRAASRASEFACQYNIPKAYGNYRDLFNDPDVDAIYIATPHNFHLEQSLQAINAGKSVLCEKPLTVNAAECESLIKAARNSNVSVMEGMWTYFLPAVQQAKTWFDAGRIGKLVHIKADFGFKMPFDAQGRLYNPDLAGGSLLDVGIYPIALTWLFAGTLPASIDVVSRFAETSVDDDLAMLLEFRDFTASLSCSFRATLPNRAFVVGDEGYVELPDFWSARQCKLFKANKLIDTFDNTRQGSGFEFQIESFSQDVLHKRKESRIMPLSTSLALQKIMHAVRKEF